MSKKQTMSLNAFLKDDNFGKVGNWADETDQFLPQVPFSQRVPDHLTLHFTPVDHIEENDIIHTFRGVVKVKMIKFFAHVEFDSEENCRAAMERDGQAFQGREIKITPSKEPIREDARNPQWNSNSNRRSTPNNESWDRSTWGQSVAPRSRTMERQPRRQSKADEVKSWRRD